MKHGITFNGIRKEYLVTLRGKNRPPWAPMRRNLLEVPGKAGAYNDSTDILPRELSIPALIESTDLSNLKELMEDLAAWLVTDEPKELIFDDEPERTYYAMVKDTFEVSEIVRVGVGMIEFICPDPYKYGPVEILSPMATNLDAPLALVNSGTVDTPAVFEITLKDDTTYIDTISDDKYMRLGKPTDDTAVAIQPKTNILVDQMASFTGWTETVGFNPDYSSPPSGVMTTNGFSFSTTNTGTGPSWHGPAKTKMLSESITDFEVEMDAHLLNQNIKTFGRIELYLMDESMHVAGKLSLRDRTAARDGNYMELRAGDLTDSHFLIQERGDSISTWLDFKGVLRLSRVGNKWSAYVAKVANGKHTARRSVSWVDEENRYNRNIKYIVLQLAGHGKSPLNPLAVNTIIVRRINNVSANDVPIIGNAGDVFTLDMKRNLILKNGDLFMKKDFGSNFFNLKPGVNSIVMDPPEVIASVYAEWRARFK